MSRLQIAFSSLSIFVICAVASASYGATASISGKVSDSAGTPQIGAMVQLLRPDLTLCASAFTDQKGHFQFSSLFPGKYALKATGPTFLPSMRENISVHTATVVNLTLSSIYELMQWLPVQARSSSASEDDWAWTLRSAANRPLLRWLEDGPLIVLSDGTGHAPHLQARLMAIGQNGTFGEDGARISVEVEDTPSTNRELLARVDFAPDSDAGMEATLGFRQDLGFAGNVETMAAVALHPELEGPGAGALQEAQLSARQTIDVGDRFEVIVGSDQLLARFADQSPNTIGAILPFASVIYRMGASRLQYRVATTEPGRGDTAIRSNALFALSARNGRLALEHGLHQELSWERRTNQSGMQLIVFSDHIDNPMIEASAHFAATSPLLAAALYDPNSGLLRTAGDDDSSAGIYAAIDHRLPGGNQLRLSYANGDALIIDQSNRPDQSDQSGQSGPTDQSGRSNQTDPFGRFGRPIAAPAAARADQGALLPVLAATRARRTQMYTLALSGTVEGTHTHWRASYRWQPESTITPVAPFALDLSGPYLNLRIRQQLRSRRPGVPAIDALFDGTNLLAQGYCHWTAADGSLLVYAEAQRRIGGGLAFTF